MELLTAAAILFGFLIVLLTFGVWIAVALLATGGLDFLGFRSTKPWDHLPGALLARNVELRIMPELWKLHDGIAASSMQFSIIRMRNAQPRSSSYDIPS